MVFLSVIVSSLFSTILWWHNLGLSQCIQLFVLKLTHTCLGADISYWSHFNVVTIPLLVSSEHVTVFKILITALC